MVAFGNLYARAGRSEKARACLRRAADEYQKRRAWESLAITLGGLVMVEIKTGSFPEAKETLQQHLALAERTGAALVASRALMERGRLLGYAGKLDEAERALDCAAATYRRRDMRQGIAVYRALCRLLGGDLHGARVAATEALARGREVDVPDSSPEPLTVWAEWLRGACEVALAEVESEQRKEHLSSAYEYLVEALRHSDALGLEELRPGVLLALARWHPLSEELPTACTRATEALRMAERCGYRLDVADAYVVLARLSVEAGDRDQALVNADSATKAAGTASHRYHAAAQGAAAVRARALSLTPPVRDVSGSPAAS